MAAIKVRWTPHPRLSAIHAAYVIASGGESVDPPCQRLLLGPVTELNDRLLSASVDVRLFWRRLIQETAADRSLPERPGGDRIDERACEIALTAAGVSEFQLEATAQAVARRIGECRSAFYSRFPKLADQLRLRSGPLKERWETYGPGLLHAVARRIWDGDPPPDWWPPRFEALLLQPIRGGAGDFDAEGQRFWLEAMLTDAEPTVPEVLRVAWLMTRIAIETHTREKSGERSVSLPWSFGSVPILLAAAGDLELVADAMGSIPTAMRLWQLGDDAVAATVVHWWRRQSADPRPLPIALQSLREMLRNASQPADRVHHG